MVPSGARPGARRGRWSVTTGFFCASSFLAETVDGFSCAGRVPVLSLSCSVARIPQTGGIRGNVAAPCSARLFAAPFFPGQPRSRVSHDTTSHRRRESCRTPLLQSGNGSSDPGTSADDGGLLAYLPPALQNNYVQLALLAAFYVFHVGVLCVNTCSVPMSWLKQGAAPVSLSWEIIFGTAGASDPVRHPKKSQLQCASGAGQHGFQRQL
jgi:hypothetical protein